MDSTSLIIVFAVILAIVVYIILDLKTEEEEILQDRLMRIAHEDNPDTIGKKKQGVKDAFMTLYLEPIINYLKKKKMENEGDESSKRDLRMLLMQSGKPYSDDDVLRYTAIQVLVGIVAFVVLLFVAILFFRNNLMMGMASVIIGGFLGYKLPVILLRSEIKHRFREIQYNLPDSLDLLVVCVEAGLGLDAALTRVANEQSRTAPVLAREFGRVSKDVLAGVPRSDAFRNLAIRNDVQELKSLVALLIQTDKLGTSIAESLRVYAETVRTKRKQKAEKLAAEASVKMVIPLVLFILPSMFVVLLGPAILNLIQQFTGGM